MCRARCLYAALRRRLRLGLVGATLHFAGHATQSTRHPSGQFDTGHSHSEYETVFTYFWRWESLPAGHGALRLAGLTGRSHARLTLRPHAGPGLLLGSLHLRRCT